MPVTRLPETETNRGHLAEALRFAVPLHIAEMRGWPADRRRLHGLPAGWQAHIHKADALMFRPATRMGWQGFRLAFALWARGLAVLAFEPGGVDLFDLHFCAAPHPDCPHDRPRAPVDVAATMAAFHRVLDDFEALAGAGEVAA